MSNDLRHQIRDAFARQLSGASPTPGLREKVLHPMTFLGRSHPVTSILRNNVLATLAVVMFVAVVGTLFFTLRSNSRLASSSGTHAGLTSPSSAGSAVPTPSPSSGALIEPPAGTCSVPWGYGEANPPTPGSTRITMQLDGPCTAKAGSVATYLLTYQVQGVPGTGVVLHWTDFNVSYSSSRLISGAGRIDGPFPGGVRWGLQAGQGVLEVQLKLPATMNGKLGVLAYEPGTGTTQSNTIITTIGP